MPTFDEQKELLNNCTWTWTARNGVNGYEVTGKNGNSIFLSAAGFRDNWVIGYSGCEGYYWSSSLSSGSSSESEAGCLYFDSDTIDWSNIGRYYGQSVRAVCSSR